VPLAVRLQQHLGVRPAVLLVHLVHLAHLEHLEPVGHLRLRQLRLLQLQISIQICPTQRVFLTQANGASMDHLIANHGLHAMNTFGVHATTGAAQTKRAFAGLLKVSGSTLQCGLHLCFPDTLTSR